MKVSLESRFERTHFGTEGAICHHLTNKTGPESRFYLDALQITHYAQWQDEFQIMDVFTKNQKNILWHF